MEIVSSHCWFTPPVAITARTCQAEARSFFQTSHIGVRVQALNHHFLLPRVHWQRAALEVT